MKKKVTVTIEVNASSPEEAVDLAIAVARDEKVFEPGDAIVGTFTCEDVTKSIVFNDP